MKTIVFCTVFVLLAVCVQAQTSPDQSKNATAKSPASGSVHTKLTYKIIDAANNTFGYDIYSDGKLMIHQNSIPAVPGNNGFTKKTDAEKVAQLVISKIKKGEMPPTVSVDELKKLSIIK